jgi:hypothetical protein
MLRPEIREVIYSPTNIECSQGMEPPTEAPVSGVAGWNRDIVV